MFVTSVVYNNPEHLMGLDKRDAVNEFVKESEAIFASQKLQLPKLMVQRVTRHYMLTSKKYKEKIYKG